MICQVDGQKKTKRFTCYGLICCVVAMIKISNRGARENHMQTVKFAIDGFIYLISMKIFKGYQDILSGKETEKCP